MIHWNISTEPQPPFIASIFNYYLSDQLDGYAEYDQLTIDLAKQMPGFLGYESYKHEGRGYFISYWKDREAISEWAKHPIHIEAKKMGKSKWYWYYHSVLADVNSFHSHSIYPDSHAQ